MFDGNAIRQTDILKFFQTLYRYQRGGVSIEDALRYYIEAAVNDDMKAAAKKILRNMRNGINFPEAIKKQSVFPEYISGLLTVGMNTSQMVPILDKIVARIEQDIDIKSKVDSATLMPKISVVVLTMVFFFGVGYVIPLITEVLVETGIELPLITRLVIGFGEFLQNLWWLVLPLLVIGAAIFKYLQKNYSEELSLWALKIPIWKEIAFCRIHYNLCHVLGLCLSSGVPIDSSLSYTSLAVNSSYVKNVLVKSINSVKEGFALEDAIKKCDRKKILDPELFVLLKTGTTSGSIEQSLMDEAEIYRKELYAVTNDLGDKVSFIVLVPIYVVIIVLLLSVEYPFISMIQNIERLAQ